MRCLLFATRLGFLATAILAGLAAGGRGQEASPPAAVATQGPRYRIADLEARWETADVPTRLAILDRIGRKKVWHDEAVPLLRKALRDRDAKVRARAAIALHWSTRASSAVAELSAALADPDLQVRNAAAWALNSVGPQARPAIPALAAMVRADRGRAAQAAFTALGSIGASALPALLEFLADPDPTRRQGAAQAIARIGPEAKAAMPALMARLDDPAREVRWAVAMALAAIVREAIDPLTQALRHNSPRVRGTAARALGHMRERAGPAAPALIDALFQAQPFDDPAPSSPNPADDENREEPPPQGIYAVLKDMGETAIPALVGRLRGRDREARVQAMRALGYYDSWENPGQAISLLLEDLADRDVRLEAVEALGKVAWGNREAIVRLIDGLKDPDPAFRAKAAEALGRVGWENQEALGGATPALGAVAPLMAALKDPDPRVRRCAAAALGDIGSESRRARPDLVRLLEDHDPEVRLAALRSFRRIGVPMDARETIQRLMKGPDPRFRRVGEALLHGMAPSDAFATELIAAVQDSDPKVRARAAANVLRAKGQQGIILDGRPIPAYRLSDEALVHSPGAGSALRKALGDPNPQVRTAAALILSVFKQEARESVAPLIPRLRDPSVPVRLAAASALGQFGADARPAVPALLDALTDPSGIRVNGSSVPRDAFRAIRAISPETTSQAADRLIVLLGDAKEPVRDAARQALSELDARLTPRLFRLLADPKTSRMLRIEILDVLEGRYGAGEIRAEHTRVPERPEIQAAIPVLRSLLDDIDPSVERNAIRLLITLEHRDEETVRLYLRGLRAQEMDGPVPDWPLKPTMIPAMLKELHDPDPVFRADLISVIAPLSQDLYSEPDPEEAEVEDEKPTPEDRLAQARDLRLRAQAADAILPLLKDADPSVRWNAAHALGTLRAEPSRVVPALVEMMRTESGTTPISEHLMPPSHVESEYYPIGYYHLGWNERDGESARLAAVHGLRLFGPRAAAAVPELVRILREEKDPRLLWYTAAAVGEIGPKANAAVPPLIAALGSTLAATGRPVTYAHFGGFGISKEDGPIRLAAAVALGSIGPDAREAVPDLTRALTDADSRVRGEAAASLGAIGPDSGPAVPALAHLAVAEADDQIADLAAEALGSIGPRAVPALVTMLRTGRATVRVRALTALEKVGPKAAAAIPELLRALEDRDEAVRAAAAETMGAVGAGPRANAAMIPLLEALRDEDPIVRQQAAEALSQIGTGERRELPGLIDAMRKSAVPPLLQSLGDEDPFVRRHAARALGKIGAASDQVVPALVRALKDPERLTRISAIEALGAVGPPATSALDDLGRLRNDQDPEIRSSAEAAIRAIRPGAP